MSTKNELYMDKLERAKILYAYNTDPNVAGAVDKRALELRQNLPVENICHEISLFGYTLIMEHEGEVVLIDPKNFDLVLKPNVLEKNE